MKEISAGTEYQYGDINIQMTSYDLCLVEHFAQYIHRLCNRLSIQVNERYEEICPSGLWPPAHQATLQSPWGIPIWMAIQTSHLPCVLLLCICTILDALFRSIEFFRHWLEEIPRKKMSVTSPSSEEKPLSLWVQSLGIADICCWFFFMVCDTGSACYPAYPKWSELGKALKVLGELPATTIEEDRMLQEHPSSPKQVYSNSHSTDCNAWGMSGSTLVPEVLPGSCKHWEKHWAASRE